MKETSVTLCFPDQEKSCFACCPPIRPAGYEHIQHENIIKRNLRENNDHFDKKERSVVPINGFSCWAIGYIDKGHRLTGCLLHPAQNSGVDLRYRVDYGNKCRRETCQEEKIFSQLEIQEQRFWLQLSDGFDTFSYSSRDINPLFKMMGWGTHLLRLVASAEDKRTFTRESFFRSYPFFTSKVLPRANAYLINRIALKDNIHILKDESFKIKFERFAGFISGRINRHFPDAFDVPYVHLLDLEPDFSDFLRLSARIHKIQIEDAVTLKEIVDEELERFKGKIQ